MLDGLLLGVVTALLTGGRLRNLEHLELRGGPILLAALLAQVFLPRIVTETGLPPWAELGVFWIVPALIAMTVAALNWRQPGMGLVAVGIGLNLVVVVLNGGMPVSLASVSTMMAESAGSALERSWLHIPASSATNLLFLADVIPVPGPTWHRGLVSLGDILMSAGVGYWTFVAMHEPGDSDAG